MAVATQPVTPLVRPRHVLLVGAFVVGWSVARSRPESAAAAKAPAIEPFVEAPVELPELDPEPVVAAPTRLHKPARLALAGTLAALVLAGAGLALKPDDARAPLVDPVVAARDHARAVKQAQAAKLHLLRRLELAGITARRAGSTDVRAAATPVVPKQPVVQPSERAIALDNYLQALGTQTILTGLDASRDQLQQQVLNDPRVSIYPAGRGDVTSGKLDVRVLAIIEYLAQANGSVGVSCLIAGHSLYVHGRPGVVSAHIYGRAVDISSVGGTSIVGHQGPGSVTEKAIRQILALPPSVEPLQVISLMTLGGPSFALPDHYDHIHVGY